MNNESMLLVPTVIRRAMISVVEESGAVTDRPGETIINVRAIIAKLDEWGYWTQTLNDIQKYNEIAIFLFPEDAPADEAPYDRAREISPGAELARTVIGDRKAFHEADLLSELETAGAFPDVEVDEHVN
jgi:hypothetical protein